MASSSNIWWQILAGNPHDCTWSNTAYTCTYTVETVTTTLYPLEAVEEFAADGAIVNAFQQWAISDNFYYSGVDILSATVYGVVYGYMDKDAYTSGVSILSADVFGTQVWTEPDMYTASHTIDAIAIIDAVFISAVEDFTADAVVTEANLV